MIVSRTRYPAVLLLSLATTLSAQQATLTLDAVLTRVRANIADYKTSLPNLSCDESVDSQRLGDGKIKEEMKVQSSFRITRATAGGEFHETRIKNMVDGKPAKSQKVNPPFTFNGGFANVLGFAQGECVEYRLGDPGPSEEGKIVLLIGPNPASPGNPACKAKPYTGRAVIDPVSFQVSHLERRHEDTATGFESHLPFVPMPSNHNVFTFSVNYAPVALGDKTFWLPNLVTATVTDKSKPISLHYEAEYSNYHRFASTITIGPATEPTSPQ